MPGSHGYDRLRDKLRFKETEKVGTKSQIAVEPALRQVSYARCAQGSTGDCDHFASMQQPADFFCKEIVSERHRLEAPFHSARVVQPAETRRRERRQCGCESCREHQFRPASIKVMQRTFNPLNRERYPGGPPTLPGRLLVGRRSLEARMLVQ